METKEKNGNEATPRIEFSDEQIEIFARRIMPEIKKYFADENVKKSFKNGKRNKKIYSRNIFDRLVISSWAIGFELSIALLFFLH